ncbi:CLUMA_CG004530, isoform A [Clunio marinus]|uniref:CLUMA_CG004530, isoform A n=1 Tax=Clunio marinus TaxID=568069 RepID=A0A1J1HRY1_9DIPT|nr:CLUMA_CG004530, isoform A [Clunio marinus]
MFLECFLISMLMIILIVNKSHTVKYHLKYLIYYGGVMVAAFLFFPYFATRPQNVLNLFPPKVSEKEIFVPRTASKILNPISKAIGLQWELRGAEHLRKNQTFVCLVGTQKSLDK